MLSLHVAGRQVRSAPASGVASPHENVEQSDPTRHVSPTGHAGQEPPQSVSVSFPSFTPSWHPPAAPSPSAPSDVASVTGALSTGDESCDESGGDDVVESFSVLMPPSPAMYPSAPGGEDDDEHPHGATVSVPRVTSDKATKVREERGMAEE
jgi:hypothetical protein